jgi:hypothetical protein
MKPHSELCVWPGWHIQGMCASGSDNIAGPVTDDELRINPHIYNAKAYDSFFQIGLEFSAPQARFSQDILM